MRILAVYQQTSRGWGRQIVEFLRANVPDDWKFCARKMPAELPRVIDHPAEFLPDELPSADLLLVLAENTGLAQLTAGLSHLAAAEAVLAPVDGDRWWPRGLQNQQRQKMAGAEVDAVFPRPFCSLTTKASDNEYIRRFARQFGRPQTDVRVDDGIVQEVAVRRSAPCGNTHHVAEELVGESAADAVQRGGLVHQFYPCLAAHSFISKSAHITAAALKKGLPC